MQILLLVLGLVGVSLSGPIMAATAAPALAIALWRNLLATAVLSPVVAIHHRGELRQQTGRSRMLAAFAGVMLAGHFAFWVTSLKLTSVAAAVAILSMQVLWVIVFDAWRGHRASPGVLIGAALAVAGVVFISGVDLNVSTAAIVGDLFALLGGMFAAAYVVVGASVRETLSTTSYTFWCYGVAAVTLLIACLVADVPLWGWSSRAWFLIVAVTVSAHLLGHSIFNHLLGTMSPVVISLVLLMEVPMAALIAAFALGESLPLGTYLGLTLILGGLAVVTRASGDKPGEQTLTVD